MKTLFLVGCLLLSTGLAAQFWQADFARAQSAAQANNQNMVLVFSGSDWCGSCIKMERDLWSQAEFQQQAQDQFLFVKVDFPRRRANRLAAEVQIQNEQLAEQYNLGGSFPLVVVLNPAGEVVGQTGYQSISSAEFLALLNSFGK